MAKRKPRPAAAAPPEARAAPAWAPPTVVALGEQLLATAPPAPTAALAAVLADALEEGGYAGAVGLALLRRPGADDLATRLLVCTLLGGAAARAFEEVSDLATRLELTAYELLSAAAQFCADGLPVEDPTWKYQYLNDAFPGFWANFTAITGRPKPPWLDEEGAWEYDDKGNFFTCPC
jgi:hypothetical protein